MTIIEEMGREKMERVSKERLKYREEEGTLSFALSLLFSS
jgi:hypothetical protein